MELGNAEMIGDRKATEGLSHCPDPERIVITVYPPDPARWEPEFKRRKS